MCCKYIELDLYDSLTECMPFSVDYIGHWSAFNAGSIKKCRVNVESFALIIIDDLLLAEFESLIVLYICRSRTFFNSVQF